jgi:hypothetical protein
VARVLGYDHYIYLEELSKLTETWVTTNSEPLEYDTGILTTVPLISVRGSLINFSRKLFEMFLCVTVIVL